MGASPAVYRPVDGRAAVPPPSRMRAREATPSPGDGLAGISCCRDVVAAGVVAPRRRAAIGAEERVGTQTAGGRPAGQRLTPETGHRPTPTAAANPAPTTGAGFRQLSESSPAGYRQLTNWAARRQPDRASRPPASSPPRGGPGTRTRGGSGSSSPGGGRRRAARSRRRTTRRASRRRHPSGCRASCRTTVRGDRRPEVPEVRRHPKVEHQEHEHLWHSCSPPVRRTASNRSPTPLHHDPTAVQTRTDHTPRHSQFDGVAQPDTSVS